MALIKPIELSNGCIAEYHKVVSITRSKDVSRGEECHIEVDVFMNKNARRDKERAARNTYIIKDVKSFSEAYTELKLNESYANSVDDL